VVGVVVWVGVGVWVVVGVGVVVVVWVGVGVVVVVVVGGAMSRRKRPVRWSDEEWDAIKQAAAKAGKGVAEWVRDVTAKAVEDEK
jgi:Flp pilus assembly protein TadB